MQKSDPANSNPPSNDSLYNSLYDSVHHTVVGASSTVHHTINTLSSIVNPSAEQTRKFYKKIDELKTRYLTREFIETKVKNAIYAKVLPLSSPPGLDEKIKEAKQLVLLLKDIRNDRQNQINALKLQVGSLKGKNQLELISKQKDLSSQKKKLNKHIKKTERIVEYFEEQKKAQISARFAGYAGMISNLVIPGSGTAISVSLTAANTAIQENNVKRLPKSHQNVERRNTRLGTLATVASTVVSVAFGILLLPGIKEAAFGYWNSTLPPTHQG